jgi:TM2 domain-containing membrane protein YozV
MSAVAKLINQPRSRKIAVLLALAGTLTTPIPIVGIHKFYLRQYVWGVLYLLLAATPIPHVACAIEAVWYLAQDKEEWETRFNDLAASPRQPKTPANTQNVTVVASSLRQLDQLRQEGLISEYEFEQKRREFLDLV